VGCLQTELARLANYKGAVVDKAKKLPQNIPFCGSFYCLFAIGGCSV
jgi:hypothetical protein